MSEVSMDGLEVVPGVFDAGEPVECGSGGAAFECPFSHEVLWTAYQNTHEVATEMGYPSITEALEHLAELRAMAHPNS